MREMDEEQLPTDLAAPAVRALRASGYTKLRDLAGVPEAQLAGLHGVGPKALRILREALEASSLKPGD